VTLARKVAAESIGTALLLATIIGSGIMAERLAGGNVALALLANTIATGAGLVALILAFGPISGAHFNPCVSVAEAVNRRISWRDALVYCFAQVAAAVIGVVVAHLMFEEALFSLSRHARSGLAQMWSEFIATFGLIVVVLSCARHRATMVPFAVGAYITAAYWFTASTSFANPAVTIARSLSDTFAGIHPGDVPGFIVAEIAGAAAAVVLMRWILADEP
jgi:glycerol uptake facilitator-like aquaporin